MLQDAALAATLLWAMLFVIYVLLGTLVTVAPAVVLRVAELQQQSGRWLRRLPLVAVGLWLVLFVVNLVYTMDLCVLCEPGVKFPWRAG